VLNRGYLGGSFTSSAGKQCLKLLFQEGGGFLARQKQMTETVMKLRAAYRKGKEMEKWNTVDECLVLLDNMPRSTFNMRVGGYVKDDAVVAETLQQMEQILGVEITLHPKDEPAPQEATLEVGNSDSSYIQELKLLFERGKEIGSAGGCWDGERACAKVTAVPYSSLNAYLKHKGPLKRKKRVLSAVRILRRKVREAEKAQSTIAPTAIQAQPVGDSQKQAAVLLLGVLQQIADQASRQTLQGTLSSLEGLLPSAFAGTIRDFGKAIPSSSTDLTHDLQEGLRLILQGSSQSVPNAIHTQDVVEATLFNQVLAGVAEFRDQNLNGVRFVLNARNFRKLHGKVTREEVEDTGLLIEELVRRFTIFAQLDDVSQRTLIAQKLTERLERLYRTIEQSRDVCPTEAAEEIGRDHQAQNLFNK
jgi:hypothetical protein